MKNIYKTIILTLVSVLMYTSCNLEENPPFLSSDNVYTTITLETTSIAFKNIFNLNITKSFVIISIQQNIYNSFE